MPSIKREKLDGFAGATPASEALAELLAERYSCRGYRPEPVPHETIAAMLAIAQQSPSWCNTQPWQVHVTEGAATDRLREAMFARASADMAAGRMTSETDLPFPANYTGVYKERQREVAWQLYEAVGVTYGDRVGSARQTLENFRLFDAPHALVITTEKSIGTYGVLDCGIFLGTLVLAAQSLGIGMIPQAAFANYCPLLRDFFGIPDNRAIICGASFGWPDRDHPANSFRSHRADSDDSVAWVSA